MIDQILDFSKIEAGRLELVEEPFDLRRLVEEHRRTARARAHRARASRSPPRSPRDAPRLVVGDSLRLRQALTNLAGNAVKFTARGGVGVCGRTRRATARLLFEVDDTGPGVPADRRAAIFEDFEQGDGSNARQFEGAGLGLAISKRLVALMGGELTLERQSRRRLDLRLRRRPAGGAVAARRRPSRRSGRSILTGRRALIVANSPFEAPAMAALLAEAGAEIVRAEGLEQGLAALEAGPAPDLVIVDCALGRRGDQPPRRSAARVAGAPKSLVLFSPFERRAFGQNSLQGFDGWLVKPVRARSLFERLGKRIPGRARRCVGAARAASPARRSRALLAEDNDINAVIAQKALRRLGFEVTRARDGAEAARLAGAATRGEAPRFDIIVMDVKMPGLDGYEATRAIRALEREIGAPRVAIIALTANAMAEDRRASLAAGIDEFLAKPFELARARRDASSARWRDVRRDAALARTRVRGVRQLS